MAAPLARPGRSNRRALVGALVVGGDLAAGRARTCTGIPGTPEAAYRIEKMRRSCR